MHETLKIVFIEIDLFHYVFLLRVTLFYSIPNENGVIGRGCDHARGIGNVSVSKLSYLVYSYTCMEGCLMNIL